MLTFDLPLDPKEPKALKGLVDTRDLLKGHETLIKARMNKFRHPVTRTSVRYAVRRQQKSLVLSVDIEDQHRDAVVKHLEL